MTIVRIDLDPYPEGPPLVVGQQDADSYAAPLRAAFERAQQIIPMPLPAPLPQSCCPGGMIVYLTLSDGQMATYGPCDQPAAIDAVSSVLNDAEAKAPPATT